MAVTLETELQSLMFSSQIPDIVIGTSDDNEVEVCLDCRDHTIFSALHFPYGRSVKIHDLRSVVEYYLRDHNTSIEDFQLRASSGGRSVTLATFSVLYLEQHFTGDINKPNTYGCDIKAMSYPQVNIVVDNLIKTNPMGSVSNPLMGYAAAIKINPSMPKDIKHVYYYRLWRIMDDYTNFDDEALLNEATTTINPEWQAYYEEIKTFYPGNGEIYVVDTYLDKALNNNDKKVTYLVRLYATNVEPNGNTLMAAANNQGKDYFIAEKKVTVTYNESIPTAINDVLENANVINVTYYNLQGMASDKPFSGLNIVVTRYSNGKSTVEKVVK